MTWHVCETLFAVTVSLDGLQSFGAVELREISVEGS